MVRWPNWTPVDPTIMKPVIWNGQVRDKSCILDYADRATWDTNGACPDIPDDLSTLQEPIGESVQDCSSSGELIPDSAVTDPGPPETPSDSKRRFKLDAGGACPIGMGGAGGGGILCTGYYCVSSPTGVPPDYPAPNDPNGGSVTGIPIGSTSTTTQSTTSSTTSSAPVAQNTYNIVHWNCTQDYSFYGAVAAGGHGIDVQYCDSANAGISNSNNGDPLIETGETWTICGQLQTAGGYTDQGALIVNQPAPQLPGTCPPAPTPQLPVPCDLPDGLVCTVTGAYLCNIVICP
jgi:hypothetical protein